MALSDEQKTARKFGREVSNFNFNAGLFAMSVGELHRTEQQRVMEAILFTINKFAIDYETGNWDARNEETVLTAKRIKDALEPFGVPKLLPFI